MQADKYKNNHSDYAQHEKVEACPQISSAGFLEQLLLYGCELWAPTTKGLRSGVGGSE